MNNLYHTSAIVKAILEENPQTRDSDSFLYLKVLEYKAKEAGIDLKGLTVPYFLKNISKLGFPGSETVRRARQKIQASNPELAASDKVKDMRSEQEKVFRAYAVGGSE